MSRDISWINEISNTSKDDYIIWAWDEDNFGIYHDWRQQDQYVGKNDDATRAVIKAGAHLVASGCGIPDGGDIDNKPKCRVICRTSEAIGKTGDPGKGLRINRVMGPQKDQDLIKFSDHATGQPVASWAIHRGEEQNLILRIAPTGIFLDERESKESTEWKAYEFGKELEKLLSVENFQLLLKAVADGLEVLAKVV